jgi:hypothetical protein
MEPVRPLSTTVNLFRFLVALAVLILISRRSFDERDIPRGQATEAKLQTDKTRCRWTVIAGDSNMREIFFDWVALEKNQTDRVVLESRRVGTLPPRLAVFDDDDGVMSKNEDKCSLRQSEKNDDQEILHRYSDHEIVVLSSNSSLFQNDDASCHIVTQMFLNNQSEVNRLMTDMMDRNFCGTYLSSPLPTQFRRPHVPDTIWLSHGFWNLPNGGRRPRTLNCTTRFEPVVQAMQKWKHQTTKLRWQTLFPINKHPKITNTYIDWDVKCHVETAKRFDLPIFDFYRYVKRRMPEAIYWKDYHLSEESREFLLRSILDTCCGGEDRYFSSTNVSAATLRGFA